MGLKLKLQRELIPYSVEDDEPTPIFLEADRVQGRVQRELEAEGAVRLRKRGEAVFADYLRYSFQHETLEASGRLRFEYRGNVVQGESLRYNLRDGTGVIEKPSYYILDLDAHGKAERMIAESRTRFRVEKATYTNCEVGDDDWYLRVSRLEVDRARDLGVARNASVVFKGVPLLYSPYLDFSLSGSRKSGLLAPSIGQTAQSGFEYTQPYYWNIAPNRDATIAPRFLSRRGVLFNGEFRYLEPSFNGEWRAEWLPNDRIREDNRYGYLLNHRHDFGHGFSGSINYQGVSDDAYFIDLSDKIAVTSITNLPREGGLSYNGQWWNVNARVQKFQTLQDPLAPVVPPYERQPQITLFADRQLTAYLGVNATGELVHFRHPTLLNARREMLYPSVSVPLETAFFYLTPKAGYHYTRYSFADDAQAPEVRALPIYSVDSAVTFERDARLFGRDYLQTLEPRLYYVYIPFRRQDQLPVFDTAVADFNLAQIFTENQFSGGDRINDANQVTAGVTSRFINAANGAELLRLIFAQRYFFDEQQVTLNTAPRSADRSDVLAAVSGSVTAAWSAELGLQYNASADQIQRSNLSLRYRPQGGRVLNLGYRFTRDSLEQADLSAQWPLSQKWTALARWSHSIPEKQLLEGLAGLEYNAGCWAARFVAHRFVSGTEDYVTSFFVQLELTGVSRIGPNPLDVLRQNISGYQSSLRPASERNAFPGY
ncbi:MAG TPA: LPS-assembly protein LptD [Burkholderiales bacterium]|nr:LPS-assembly protein LptD [Burkholderiales bacterium]